jgi:hypothetical protein
MNIAMALEIPIDLAVIHQRLTKMSAEKRKHDLKIYLGYRYRYKYFPLTDEERVDHLRNVLVRSRFWLSPPTELNDPFELQCEITFDGTVTQQRKRLDDLLKEGGWHHAAARRKKVTELMSRGPEALYRIIEEHHWNSIKTVGVCCFAGSPLNILMWSHYANGHRGVCLQFDSVKGWLPFLCGCRVDYRNEYPMIKWTTDHAKDLGKFITRKYLGWKYEDESRIIYLNGAHQHVPVQPQALISIFVGCEAEADCKIIKQLLKERLDKGHPTPAIYRVLRHPKKYQLIAIKDPNF